MTDAIASTVVMASNAVPEIVAEARLLATRLGLSFVEGSRPGAGLIALVRSEQGWSLCDAHSPTGQGVQVDFAATVRQAGGRLSRREPKASLLSRRQPLGRAIGRQTRTVVDATAGLGRDAALLAGMGFKVLAIERSPIMFALLEDGLRRAHTEPRAQAVIGDRLTIVRDDALTMLPTLDPPPDAILIDPMFPPKRKASALAKKDIRLVRAVVGVDADAAALLGVARQTARRVIVKRADDGPPLASDPTLVIPGKTVRYDVYCR